ncbi:MAG: glycosyltransferase family 2 protein [Gammaproteobacteria bacterium]
MAPRTSICVALCTYDGEAYLCEQLDSITQQSRFPDRMVVVDDRSGDATLGILREFASRAPFPVEVIKNETNLGYVKNFEKAISLADGDVIALSDQDDVWNSNKLATVERTFFEHPDVDLVFSDAVLVGGERKPFPHSLWQSIEFDARDRRLVQLGQAFNVLLRRNVVTGATMAFRSRFKQRVLPIPEEWVHDEWIAILIAATGNIRFIPEKLIEYRQHGANQIGARKALLHEKMRFVFTSRAGFHEKAGLKTKLLRERLSEHTCSPVPQNLIGELEKKLGHLAVREKLPRSRLLRLGPISGEIIRGNYLRYSNGWKSVVRDLFEPS